MQPDRLRKLFKPESIALFGASQRPGALGTVLLDNIRTAGFAGKLVLINPKYDDIDGQTCFPSLEASGQEVDTAVVVAPAPVVPDIITECGEHGVAAAIVLCATMPARTLVEQIVMMPTRPRDTSADMAAAAGPPGA